MSKPPTPAALLKRAIKKHTSSQKKRKLAQQKWMALNREVEQTEIDIRKLANQLLMQKVGPEFMKHIMIHPITLR